jgi:uncharacterized protein (TIGR03435 family)
MLIRTRSCTIVLLILLSAITLKAQSAIPQRQVDAGANLSFEVASLRPAAPSVNATTNLDLDPSDYFRYTGGPVTASGSLINYILFAYKIQDRAQADFIYKQLPVWTQQPYTLRATTAGSHPTKDQLRLMVQSLLADRFHFKLHTELRDQPVYDLVVDHQPAPGLTPAPDDGLCARPFDQPKPPPHPTVLPWSCQLVVFNKGDLRQARMQDYTLDQIAGNLIQASLGALDPRPVLNRTGLTGNFDFSIEFLPPKRHIGAPATDAAPEEPGATFEDALKQQAGLKLVKQTGPVPVYVIDHIEPPSEN